MKTLHYTKVDVTTMDEYPEDFRDIVSMLQAANTPPDFRNAQTSYLITMRGGAVASAMPVLDPVECMANYLSEVDWDYCVVPYSIGKDGVVHYFSIVHKEAL